VTEVEHRVPIPFKRPTPTRIRAPFDQKPAFNARGISVTFVTRVRMRGPEAATARVELTPCCWFQ
jgi:hypothetical protein